MMRTTERTTPATQRRSTLWTTTAAALALWVVSAAPGLAATPKPGGMFAEANKPDTGGGIAVTTPRALIAERLAILEKELAGLMVKRPDTPAGEFARRELTIDMKILARWVLAGGLTPKASDDAMASAWLRSMQVADAAVALDGALDRQVGQTWTKPQADALNALHQLTFDLPEVASPREADEVCRKLAAHIAGMSNTQVDLKTLPHMRPRPIRSGPVRAGGGPRAGEAWTPQQYLDEARRLNVTVALRQQIIDLAKVTTSTAGAGGKDKEAAALLGTLDRVTDLARGLQANTAVTSDVRQQMEAQLTEGLALYLDQRTRAAGLARVDALQQYGQTVARIQAMNLSASQMQQLGPVFAWAQQNPEGGARAIAAVEKFAHARAKVDARPKPSPAAAAYGKALQDLEAQFDRAGAAFLAAAAEMGKPTGLTGPGELEKAAEEVHRVADLLVKVDGLPKVVETIVAFKPRPFGALERRVALSVNTAASLLGGAGKLDAVRFLDDLARLAGLVTELDAIKTSAIPPEVDRVYAGGKLAQLDAKWRALVSEAASAAVAAPGAEIDKARVARLQAALKLLTSLREAVTAELALQNYGGFARWVDWKATPQELRELVTPYALVLTTAVGEFVADTAGASQWAKDEKRYRPMVVLVERVAPYRDQISQLPAGLTGQVAALATPMDGAPFATERYVSIALAVRARAAQSMDPVAAEEISTAIARRLARDLRVE